VDECFETTISAPAKASSAEIALYYPYDQFFTKATQTKASCEEATYSIITTGTNAVEPAVFGTDPFSYSLFVWPEARANVGAYSLKLRSCVTIQPFTAYQKEICVDSATFTITIFDSCYTTQITQVVSAPIWTVMQRGQMETETMNLKEEMGA